MKFNDENMYSYARNKTLISYTKIQGFLDFAPNIILTVFFCKVSFDCKTDYPPLPPLKLFHISS